jgi:hypothetical protein
MGNQNNKYWISDDKFIFTPNFSDPLDENLLHLIRGYKKLIFSDYDNSNITIKTNNKYEDEYFRNYSMSQFNQPIDGLMDSKLTHLVFGYSFNQPVSGLMDTNLTHLVFGYSFNQPVGGLIDTNLIHLEFGNSFNYPLIGLPETLIYLQVGNSFNYPLIGLPETLINLQVSNSFNLQIEFDVVKYLTIECNNLHLVENFPNTLEELVLDGNFNLELNNLPSELKIISFKNDFYDKDLNNLPDSINLIELPFQYKKKY